MAGCGSLSDGAFHSLAAACPHLERMDLEECHLLTDSSLYQFAIHCFFIKGTTIQPHPITTIFDTIPVLELTLSHCENVTDEGIRQLCEGELRYCLESIDLDNCPLLTDASLRALSNCPKLKSVELVDCLQITRSGIDALNNKLIDGFQFKSTCAATIIFYQPVLILLARKPWS